jgi:hypothetical protein
MKAGDYRIQVHILEAKDIKSKGKAGGGGFMSRFEGETADPMVEVSLQCDSSNAKQKIHSSVTNHT